jgi:hypothetical protein
MPAIANIVVADATPTDHTLVPLSAFMANSQWSERSAAIFEGNARVMLGMSPPTSQRPTTRNVLKLYVPVEQEVDGVTVVTDTILFTLDHVLSKTVSDADALKAYTMFKNLVAHATVQSYMASREPAY